MSGEPKIKSEIDLVEKVTKQLITLSSGIIVILVTVLGYYLEYFHDDQPVSWTWTAFIASICLLLSIIFGIFVYGSLISTVHKGEKLEVIDVYGCTIRSFAFLQWISFISGIGFLIVSLYLISF